MEPISAPARYVTLRDYLRVLRRYEIAILVITVLGTLAGFVAAESQSKSYLATASVYFQDPGEDITFVGLSPPGLVQSPSALATLNAETFTRPAVMDVVKQRLRTPASVGRLAGSMSSAVSTGGHLQISATTSDPHFSALLANTVASVVVEQSNAQAKATFGLAADEIRHQIATIRPGGDTAGAVARLGIYEDELARLEGLSKFAQSAQIAEPAQPPSGASSPKVLRSTLIGLAVGLALAIAVAFFRDAMDRRLRTAQAIESVLPYPVLAQVRSQALGRIRHPAEAEADLETFRILRRNLEFLNIDSPPRAIIVTSGVAEEGKTTVAGSLAFAMLSAGKRTLLVDCDLRRSSLAKQLSIPGTPGMSDFLRGEAAPNQILRTIRLPEGPSVNGANAGPSSNLLVVIPAGSPTSHATELLGSRRFAEFLQGVLETYDAVVIDSSPLLPVADTLEMLPHVDGVVVCARESKTTRDEALAVQTALARFPELLKGVVITGATPRGGEGVAYTHSYSSQLRDERVHSPTT